MRRLIVIHSYDATTEFLFGTIQFLENKGYRNFEYIRLVPGQTGEETRQIIRDAGDGSTIVFMGHGASHCTYMPRVSGDERSTEFFINNDNFEILDGKNFISLSCRSAEFARRYFEDNTGSTAIIGFDDLPTHWDDVRAEREMGNPQAYSGITDGVLIDFRQRLVDIFAKSLFISASNNMNFKQFYHRLRLFTNRHMFEVANYEFSKNPALLANMLYDLKTGIVLLGNTNSPLL